ncbi:hypothetical protein [Flavobacterium granuli]|uniref:Uncharacterized protein n=1 Tax=Flavobacterium granuli TaxID=280093 RepID=A0A1M5PJE1_9FLAO|nr:hypothetical protein [Flavobacterium granuli]PRZ26490.1 hypothetical protein BC624_102464 [Flavobacterium granuli]SHH01343.1 hypothetical protein SAMN05443373_10661 [Flavobacterium granuli]
MDLQSEKLELIKMILETNDKVTIETLKSILQSEKKNSFKELSSEQQEEINLVIQKENRGDIVDF